MLCILYAADSDAGQRERHTVHVGKTLLPPIARDCKFVSSRSRTLAQHVIMLSTAWPSVQVLSSLDKLHQAKPQPRCAVLCCEGALILWDRDDQHVTSEFTRLQTSVATMDKADFADVDGLKPGLSTDSTQAHAGAKHGKRLLLAAGALLAAAVACFTALAILVRYIYALRFSLLCPQR